ncbi:MAG: hypothetical protein C3F12_01045 [Candidatus Methylomirabilota bacterium]|nr:MAG: hypothetical protein C3F12_01045 [candidate division NC10 bacterium]
MRVTVKAHGRLHFGFIDPDGSSGRKFGSIGLAIGQPAIILEATPAGRLSVVGHERNRVLTLMRRFLRHYTIRDGAQIAVKAMIPTHAGLGSGTQLALSVAAALARLFSIDADVRELAAVMGRGARSGIGIAAFERGGFIVDAGRKTVSSVECQVLSGVEKGGGCGVEGVGTRRDASRLTPHASRADCTPPILARYPFPEDWTFVVAIPRVGRGLAGTAETNAFQGLVNRHSTSATDRLSRIVLMRMLPSVLDRDPVVFGESLTRIQRIVGGWFRPAQGGIFATIEGATLVKAMSRAGALGVGQSSWGPAVYGLARDRQMAASIIEKMRTIVPAQIDADIFPARAFNRGATIRVSSP